MHNDKHYNRGKLIMSGPIWELFRYYGSIADRLNQPHDNSPEAKREWSLNRARINLKRKINANAGAWWDEVGHRYFLPLFLTLTFAENVTDVPTANKEFHKFMNRLNRRLFKTNKGHIKYTTVIEFQERGAVHYHILMYNIPFIENLHAIIQEKWGLGFVWLIPIYHVDNVGSYVTKYMSKDLSDERLRGKKTHFSSKNLIKPKIEKDELEIMELMELVGVDPETVEFPLLDYARYKLHGSYLRYLNAQHERHPNEPETNPAFLLPAPKTQLRLFPVETAEDSASVSP